MFNTLTSIVTLTHTHTHAKTNKKSSIFDSTIPASQLSKIKNIVAYFAVLEYQHRFKTIS